MYDYNFAGNQFYSTKLKGCASTESKRKYLSKARCKMCDKLFVNFDQDSSALCAIYNAIQDL